MPAQQITVSVGEPVEISLRDSGGSTGYVWMVAEIPPNVFLEDIDFVPPLNPIPGRPGKRVFTFLGVIPGEGQIRLVEARPWDPTQPAATRTYRVLVTQD